MRRLIIILVSITVLLTGTLPARAETFNYSISDAVFDDKTEAEGKLYGQWVKAEDKTPYSVSLYKGTTRLSTKRMSGNRIDFSSLINSKRGGAGKYTFTVYPTKGGESMKIASEELEVTSAMASAIKARINAEYKAKIAAAGGGWMRGPGNIWIYYDKDGNQLKSQWIEDNGFKYYLDKNGIMLTGWQAINKMYYYLEPRGSNGYPMGACWVDTKTPDGYKVDKDGARINEAGEVQKVQENKYLSTVAISVKEEQTPGTYTKITGISCGSGTVENIVFASDPATWTTETTGVVTFDVKLTNDYRLKTNVKAACSRAAVTITKKEVSTFSAEMHYTPKYVLKAPENLYINPDYVLRWDKVQRAGSYTIKLTVAEPNEEGELKNSTKTSTVETNRLDLSSLGLDEGSEIRSFTISATGGSTKSTVSSALTKVDDFAEFVKKNTIPGIFSTNNVGRSYVDENGEKAVGWKEIGGYWYHFSKAGYAEKGWFQDTDGNWYYFDDNCRMLTGDVTLDGKVYHLNTQAGGSPPLGAWIQK